MTPVKKYGLPLLKYGVSLGLLTYLIAANREKMVALAHGEKQWWLVGAALAVTLLAVMLTFVRWCWLIRALDVPCSMREAFRLGFLGYLFTFLSLGVLGGDVLKIVLVARQRPRKRPEAVASVMIDRAMGLYALFVVAALGAALFDFQTAHVSDPAKLETVQNLCRVVGILVLVGAVAFGVLMLPGLGAWSLADKMTRWPKALQILARLMMAVRMYRRRLGFLLMLGIMSVVIHVLNVVSVYCVARGLDPQGATLDQEFIVTPLAMTAGTLPLPGGLGAFEAAYDFLHKAVTGGETGLDVALVYRAITLLVALVGLGYYLFSRAEVADVMHEAEREEARGEAYGSEAVAARLEEPRAKV